MMNFKQKEIIGKLFDAVKEKFPEIEFISVTEGPENPADFWINVTAPEDEEREDELIEFVGDRGTDILLDYGYYFLVMPRKKTEGIGSMKYQEIFA